MAIDVREIAALHRGDWVQRYSINRRVLAFNETTNGSTTPAQATPGFVGQIIDILLDNALRHGKGEVVISVSHREFRISDQGSIDPERAAEFFLGSSDPAAPHGRGLALARRLAQADGGKLDVMFHSPTTFLLVLPADTGSGTLGLPDDT